MGGKQVTSHVYPLPPGKLRLCQVPELQEQFKPSWPPQSTPASRRKLGDAAAPGLAQEEAAPVL